MPEALAGPERIEDWPNGGFALYVHWPFCASKCPYCDFNSHVVAQVDQGRWAKALAQEVHRVADLTGGRVLNSIFFGGGTPSLMAPRTVETILHAAKERWAWANDIEITLEANPGSSDEAAFDGFAQAGINRVSLGVQALDDQDLKRLGRLHSTDDALRAFHLARRCFDRVSFDLIYARQDQTLDAWRSELTRALDLAVDHLSLYQLTIEPETAFGARAAAGLLKGLPSEDLSADMYEMTNMLCESAGYGGYEVSNYAISGAESRHNLVYWRYGDYAGVGPGAHGRLTVDGQKQATEAWSLPGRWMEAVASGSGDKTVLSLAPRDQFGEYLLMGLRVTEGVSLRRLTQMSADALDAQVISDLETLGLLWRRNDQMGVTDTGRLVLNSVVAKLLPG